MSTDDTLWVVDFEGLRRSVETGAGAAGRHVVSNPWDAIEYCYEQGWTDGLPVVPPTADRVRAVLSQAGTDPDRVLGRIPERNREITAEKAAINAVMAGCRPEYARLVFAAVEAMTDPELGLHGPAASTSGVGILVVVNGPIRHELGLNARENVFGTGYRANATVGRALRLMLINIAAARPGELDRSTLGHAGKFTYCIAEDEDASAWTSLHVQRGLKAEQSAVTVMAAEAPRQVNNHVSRTPEGLLQSMADQMRAIGSFNMAMQAQALVVLAGEHRRILNGHGWDKERIAAFLHREARRSVADLKRFGAMAGSPEPGDEDRWRAAVKGPEHILVVAAGGDAGGFSGYCAGFASSDHSRAVTRPVTSPVGSEDGRQGGRGGMRDE